MPGPTRAYYDNDMTAASPGRPSPGGGVVSPEAPSDFAAGDAAVAEAQQGAIGAAAPMLDQPVGADRATELGEALVMAYDALTASGDKSLVPTIAPMEQGQVAQIPPEIFAPLAAFGDAMQAAVAQGVEEAKPYAFDATEMASTIEGVAEVTALLKKAAQDEGLHAALVAEPEESPEAEDAEAPAAPPPEGTMSPEDIDAMLQ